MAQTANTAPIEAAANATTAPAIPAAVPAATPATTPPPANSPQPAPATGVLFSVSPDGALVIDHRAKLVWARCVEGMFWNGRSCSGRPQLLTHSQARERAKQRWQKENLRWRLPRVNELRRLVNRSTNPPAVNPELFPNAPQGWHWTGTASVNAAAVNPYAYGTVERSGEGESILAAQQGWAVNMGKGEGRGDMGRATALAVRLVRPLE